MIFAMSPLASHALVWTLLALVGFLGWLGHRCDQARAHDRFGTDPAVDTSVDRDA